MGSSSQTIGYWYRYILHYGLCRGPVDAVREMRVGDRTAWRGRATSSKQVYVNKPNLFGGEKGEGGLVGYMDIMMGESTQMPNSYLAANMGPQQSGLRGKLSAVWRGGKFGAMSPYPKPVAFKVERILADWPDDTVWYSAKAPIAFIPPKSLAIYFALDCSTSMQEITGNGLSRLANMKAAVVDALEIIDNHLSADFTVDIMIVGWGGTSGDPMGRESILKRNVTSADITALGTWLDTMPLVEYATNFPAAVQDVASFYAAAPANAERLVFFITDGEPGNSWLGVPTEAEKLEQAEEAAATLFATTGIQAFGMNIDLDNTTWTAYVDNTSDDGVPVLEGADSSALTGAVLDALGGSYAMNPAHMIYESIIARSEDGGQGEPVGLINDASFTAAADKLHSEGFGLCTTWDGEESAEEFQDRICNVIGASLSQSRVDGQYYLDLIRDDYVLADLPIISEDDAIDFVEEPTNLSEAINQVQVGWFDSAAKESRLTPPLSSLGGIQAAGGVIAESFTHREIPVESIAMRVAARYLGMKSRPLSRYTLTTNRRPYALRPGQFFRLQMTSEGIADVVCLAGEIDYGELTNGRMKIVAVQDVFGLPSAVFVDPVTGVDTGTDITPVASANQRAFEAPYVELAGVLSRADLAAMPADAGYLGTVATRPSGRGLNYAIHTAADSEAYVDRGLGDWCPSALVVEAAAPLDTAFTISGSSDVDQVVVGTWALWGDEIVRVDAIDETAGTLTLGRGCADTVPAAHAAGDRIYFAGDWVGRDGREYVDAEVVHAKLLTRTTSALLAIGPAVANDVTMDQRAIRPYPPGRLLVSDLLSTDVAYPASAVGAITAKWAHRDRVLQADQLVDTEDASVGPEVGTTYTIDYEFPPGTVVATEAGITGTSATPYTFPGDGQARIAVTAVRDGFTSWQALGHTFDYLISPNNTRIVVGGDRRVTTGGDVRQTKG